MFCQDTGAVHGLRMLIAMLPIMAILASGHQLPTGNHKLCGSALSEALDLVCANGYNTLPQKRLPQSGVPGADYSSSPLAHLLLSNWYALEDGDGDVASGFGIKTRRQRRHFPGGVYDECCVSPCSYDEISAYCLSN
ncbi:hypothetical protein KR200_002221 [Drosophila serrata]|nr:hypothetical protein KR200_002221 [Drosophila serrata]